ncbi:BMC domain-containing protein [Clostridium grantii]|uniref:BMC domain-containing protein n=1 Tax=Clostridium grantii DSM 8605 TaxID=1121316 RepID=A0A1M5SXY2_9CLOT|nr:BMC domain-containing protein [Clostridium grantii]SHH43158.1 BMC domain-containing protein [Clostridium grantii DSM 8605]
MFAIGIVEVSGYVTSVEVLDAMLKTANVEFVTSEKKLGGRLVTIVVKGNVSAVTAAVEMGKESADKVGKTVASAVIPNPHEELIKILNISAKKYNNK